MTFWLLGHGAVPTLARGGAARGIWRCFITTFITRLEGTWRLCNWLAGIRFSGEGNTHHIMLVLVVWSHKSDSCCYTMMQHQLTKGIWHMTYSVCGHQHLMRAAAVTGCIMSMWIDCYSCSNPVPEPTKAPAYTRHSPAVLLVVRTLDNVATATEVPECRGSQMGLRIECNHRVLEV